MATATQASPSTRKVPELRGFQHLDPESSAGWGAFCRGPEPKVSSPAARAIAESVAASHRQPTVVLRDADPAVRVSPRWPLAALRAAESYSWSQELWHPRQDSAA